MADPEDQAFQLALAAGNRDAVAVAERHREVRRVQPIRHPHSRHDRRTILVGREELEAHRLDPGAAGAPEPDMALERIVQAAVEEESKRHVESDNE
jgi:hypothetical protein